MRETEARIRQAVTEQLAADPRIELENAEVTVVDGQVILRGTASSYRAKWAAAEAARRVEGVSSVDNRLEVRLQAPGDDERIAASIRRALMGDTELDSSNINVVVHGGQVVLTGAVPSGFAKSRAEQDARWTQGVESVSNRLVVVPSRREEDASLALLVERALRGNAMVNADAIDVVVDDRHVTLSGVVRSWDERTAALEDALRVPGVVDVRDELAVQTPRKR
ncbi:MAG: BON domain-containing protein [Anaerolineae bacterium]|nr:BON domain-containing protein [Anaerolineae bacterium]